MKRTAIAVLLLMAFGFGTVGGTRTGDAQQAGLWDAHSHLSYYGEKALGLLVARAA